MQPPGDVFYANTCAPPEKRRLMINPYLINQDVRTSLNPRLLHGTREFLPLLTITNTRTWLPLLGQFDP